jgi:hypothetical protein
VTGYRTLAIDDDACVKILDEAGFLPMSGIATVDLKEGLTLALGRRDLVVLDQAGDIHTLARCYPCIELVDQGVTTGNAYLRYFVEGGVHFVQARTVAQKYWDKEGPVDQLVSTTAAPGGINLRVELLP